MSYTTSWDTIPAIMADMQIDATSAGVMAGSALFGTMLGAIFLGTLADRIGRPKMIAICVALFSIFTAAAGFTDNPLTFSIMRFIAGLGSAACCLSARRRWESSRP